MAHLLDWSLLMPMSANVVVSHDRVGCAAPLAIISLSEKSAPVLGSARMLPNMVSVRRLPDIVADPGWGLWILSHVDMRMTARVHIFRDFMMKVLEPCFP